MVASWASSSSRVGLLMDGFGENLGKPVLKFVFLDIHRKAANSISWNLLSLDHKWEGKRAFVLFTWEGMILKVMKSGRVAK